MARHTFSRTRELVQGPGSIKELTLEFCQLEPSSLQRLVLVGDTAFDETKT